MTVDGLRRQLDKREVARQFGRAAVHYEAHDLLQREVAQRLLERLDYINLVPGQALDLGSGTGRCSRELATRYKRARIIEADIAVPMLNASRAAQRRWFSRHRHVAADAERLPFRGGVFDLVFSNLALQWCEDLPATFGGIRHTLRDGGLLLFTTLGPDTLHELRTAFAAVSDTPTVNSFIDMHIIGDQLGAAGFADPVMEMEYLTVEYDDVLTLMRDLKGIGAVNANIERSRTLLGRRQLRGVIEAYEKFRRGGRLPATYEVVFGHAWAATPRTPKGATEHVVSLDQLRRNR